MTYHGKATDQMTEREWRRAQAEATRGSHPALRQRHDNPTGEADLRAWEWRRLRPNDHMRRKAIVGRA